jgi:hypothetical protein
VRNSGRRNIYISCRVIRVLSGKHRDEGGRKPEINGRSLVGGSTLLFFPRPGLRVRDVTYDPANLGILTGVTIGIGPTDSVLWIAAYIPCKGGKEEGNGLEAKLRAWYFKTRAPSLVDGEEKSEGDRKFDAISWIWDFLLPDRVARSQLNLSHVGVILTGDLNQRLDNSDQSRRSLRVRTEAMGLYANLAERFQHLDSKYSTWGRGRMDLKEVHMIDNVFTSLPDQVFRAGGSPSGEEWKAVSDHLPICGSFHFEQLQGCVEGRRKKYIAKLGSATWG